MNERFGFRDRLIDVEPHGWRYAGTSIEDENGRFLWDSVVGNGYTKTVEIGCALGLSSLYICDALAKVKTDNKCEVSHTIIDPFEKSHWKGIGIANLDNNGYGHYSLIEKPSETALPGLLEKGESFDFGFIDGKHTFDHALIDFFYLNRMVRTGGMIVFDDVRFPSIARLLRYVSRYPCYEIVETPRQEKVNALRFSAKIGLIKAAKLLSRIMPGKAARKLFSGDVLNPNMVIEKILSSGTRVVALRKLKEDDREGPWFVDF